MGQISSHIDEPAGVTFGVTPVTQASADSAAEGSSGAAARGDHKHGIPTLVSTFAGLSDVKIVRKTADETVNNSDVLQNDDALLFAVAANEVWEFILICRCNGTNTANLKTAFAIPAGADGTRNYIGFAGTGASLAGGRADMTTTFIVTLGASGNAEAVIMGVIVNGSTAGNLQFQWAQNTATVEDTKVLADSCIIAHRIA